jgi:hypothetical protein
MLGPAGFYADQARRKFLEEFDQLRSSELLADDDLSRSIDAMHLKNMLGEIWADGGTVHCG